MARMSMKQFYVGVKGVVRDDRRGVILLHREYKSGDFWDVPGGRIDGDEDFKDALKRELNEELPGISNVKVGNLLGAFRVHKDLDEDVGLVLLYFMVEARLPSEITLSEEHSSHVWVKSRADLPQGLNTEIEKILKGLLSGPELSSGKVAEM